MSVSRSEACIDSTGLVAVRTVNNHAAVCFDGQLVSRFKACIDNSRFCYCMEFEQLETQLCASIAGLLLSVSKP